VTGIAIMKLSRLLSFGSLIPGLLLTLVLIGCKSTLTVVSPTSFIPIALPSSTLERQQAPASPISLSSVGGVDYTKLRDLLASGKFKEADRETYEVMLKAMGRESLNRMPCQDLTMIDQLWRQSSNGRFGFRVQQRIYQSMPGGKDPTGNGVPYNQFMIKVGWSSGGHAKRYDQLDFTLTAPEGHLPASFTNIVAHTTLLHEKGVKNSNSFGAGMAIGLGIWSFLSQRELCTPAPLIF
jgi:hypothetical protein